MPPPDFHAPPDRLLTAILDATGDAIFAVDLEGAIRTWNPGAERLLGFGPDEILGGAFSQLMPEAAWAEPTRLLEAVRQGRTVERLETVWRARDGGLVDVQLTMTPLADADGHPVGAACLARDIGAQKRGELARRTSEERWRSIVDSAVDGVIVIDARGLMESVNPATERLFGYRASELVGRNVSMLMPPPYRDEHDSYLARYLQTGAARIIGIGREVTGLRRDGTTFPLHLSVGELSVDGERRFTGILHDLSERVRLEERLRTSESRWRAIVDSAVDGIIVIDAHGRIDAFNPAAERMFGYQEADVVGRNVNVLMPEPYHSEHDGYLARYLSAGERRVIGIGREVTARRRDGGLFPVHLSVGEMTVGGEKRFSGILHDLTRRVAMEEQLREQAALVRLGEMAAVVAHEVKNPLAGIRGAIQVIGGRLPPGGSEAGVVKEVVARIDSLNDMMQDLLLFARPPRVRPAPVEIAPLVEATAAILREDPAVSAVHVEIEGSAPRIHADSGLLRVVFLNLMMNGAHAMEGRGRIRVSLAGSAASCRISFTDEGPGIPHGIRDKVLAPFFTTKARGTGLGLPTAKRLVEAHQGTLSITCPPSGGTTVSLELPIPS